MTRLLVIGGGVMGLATSWRLAGAGYQVTLVTKETCGAGASAASLGALMPYNPWHHSETAVIQRQSLWSYPAFVAELYRETGIDPAYRTLGRLQWLSDARQRQQYEPYVERDVAGWPQPAPLRYLTPHALAQRYPAFGKENAGAVLCTATAHVMPDALCAALRAACLKRGVDIIEHCPVTGVSTGNGQVTGVMTAHGRMAADGYVFAAGAWNGPLLEMTSQIIPQKGEALLLQHQTSFPHLIRGKGIYVIPLPYHRYFVGASKENVGFDDQLSEETADTLRYKAEALLPHLAEATVARHWCGFRPLYSEKRLLCGPVGGYQNIVVVAGHGGIGMCLAPEMSRMALAQVGKLS